MSANAPMSSGEIIASAPAPLVRQRLRLISQDGALGADAEFCIGLRSLSYLADHGFRDMVVLPGSVYIEMALCLEHELGAPATRLVTNATFQNPIILAADDTLIKVTVRDAGANRFQYTFYEAAAANGGAARPFAAKLEIDRSPERVEAPEPFPLEGFQTQAEETDTAEGFYRALRQNGNQYGPSFQEIVAVWRKGQQVLGKSVGARGAGAAGAHYLAPTLVDALSQLLAACVLKHGKTFVLRSIARLDIFDSDFGETLWGHAKLLSRDGEPGAGTVRLFDVAGRCHLQLSGVGFSFLDEVAAVEEAAQPTCVIAANFTAEPIEDSLNFWQDHFKRPTRIQFAPYNQLFQQLLDPASALRRNRGGANAILLRLEEWAAVNGYGTSGHDHDKIDRALGKRPRCVLPNGIEIAHLNQYETDYLYQEIFADRCYMKNGVDLPDGATVVDIGANIGMFSLFVMSQCQRPAIYAYEPAPAVYDLLQANGAAHGGSFHAFNLGVSDQPKTATFTFYEKSSVFSSFHPDQEEDRHAIQAVVRNLLNRQPLAGASVDPYVEELTADRLQAQSYPCRLTSVSEIIRENRLDKIDLLKIDAEKSELAIISGIGDQDWPKIHQIVMEIHDRSEAAIRQIENVLTDKGFHCAVEQEALLEKGGLFNLFATRRQPGDDRRAPLDGTNRGAAALARNREDFCAALSAFASQSSTPLVILFCPRVPTLDAGLAATLDGAETALVTRLETIANVHAVKSATIRERYPVRDFHDSHSLATAHVPYTPAGYAALGSALMRALFSVKREPLKVIALDCDNTLWRGVCGEDGYQGIEIGAPHRALQQFMVEQSEAGMLLCLCSKNNETDVFEVFERRGDMVLKREHLVAWRINWQRKSDNLKALARELNLGLDSFIFLDDSPVECAEVRQQCPSVLTLQLPQEDAAIVSFLQHIWAFDRSGSLTEEDRQRTKMYQENAQRQQYLTQALSLQDFIKGLQLRVEIAPMSDDQLGRVSQQTLRTNQFNFTTVRRSESEIKSYLSNPQAHCMVVRVIDRFGDYGLVGVLMYERLADRLKVDTFLLSCRVLGRGVEHAIVAWLGQQAVADGKARVELVCRQTDKNAPAREFVTSIGAQYGAGDDGSWLFSAHDLSKLEYAPDEHAALMPDAEAGSEAELSAPPATAVDAARSERLQRIGAELNDIEKLTRAIEKYRVTQQAVTVEADATPASTVEARLRDIWKRVLGRPHIGLQENFFEVGGSSLRAVQVIAEIKKELQQTLSIVNLFEAPTLSLLAAKLNGPAQEASGETAMSEAVRRGQQRRAIPSRPRAT